MLDIKLIATDIDGTILPRGGVISETTRRVARLCRERGVAFVIASGRWCITAQEVARDVDADSIAPVIIANGGAVVAPDGMPLHEWTMRPEDVQKTYEILKRHDVMINSFVRNGLYRLNTRALGPSAAGILKHYLGEDFRIVSDDQAAFEERALSRVYKMEAIVEDEARLTRVRAELEEAGLSVTSSYWRNLEIMSPGMGKGTAVKWLARQMGVTMDQCMAFGDNTNDMDMMDAVGWPVAVENAVEELKAHARIIAPSSEQDGVAQVILRHVLGEE